MFMVKFIVAMAKTYPFWATPLSIGLIIGGLSIKKTKHSNVAPYLFIFGLIGFALVVVYVMFDGYGRLVPWLHEWLISPFVES